ncbi:hypothetical protein [Halobiforma nitratireducens]|uniref:Uncharacterized protein n=1 Tax=Halobiforma nitratireducens JCM 10879 TaxID=1227454 RepID=M0LIH7_9EURY|nr:hypothetical protein [Halobiforma nitratireducens]EMA33326.1 hypothetical protein C446_13879 [Halobiforma nitratireducens JCM 10879]
MSTSSSTVRVGRRIRSRAGHGASRARKPAFYLATVAFVAFLLFALGEAMAMAVTAWLGGYAFPGHRVHHSMIGGTLAVFAATVAVQLYRPTKRVGALQAALAFAVAAFVLTAIASGPAAVGEILVFLVPVVLIALLHPARSELVPRLTGVDRRVLAVAGVGAIGFAALAVTEFVNHTTLADEHVLMGHYEFMLFGLVSIGLFGLLGALKPTGWRTPLYAAGILALLFAASSLAFPGVEQGSSLGTVGAIAVILWAISLIGVSEYVERSGSGEPPADDASSA